MNRTLPAGESPDLEELAFGGFAATTKRPNFVKRTALTMFAGLFTVMAKAVNYGAYDLADKWEIVHWQSKKRS
jgi:hypothetical protein